MSASRDRPWLARTAFILSIQLASELVGEDLREFVTETFQFDGGRQVTVFLPTKSPEAILFATDGQHVIGWGHFLEDAAVRSTMIVGVHSLADETLRLHEYSPVFDLERFSAHETFFVEDVPRWTKSQFGVILPLNRTAIFGVSAGGELALALGLRYPQLYGAILSASPGGATSRPLLSHGQFRVRTLSLEDRNRSFSTTQNDGQRRCTLRARMWSCRSGMASTAVHSGEKSFLRWSRGPFLTKRPSGLCLPPIGFSIDARLVLISRHIVSNHS
jgi:hypothetical protein